MKHYDYKKTISEIATQSNLDILAYFGSYNTEYFNSESDIDIAYLSRDNLNIDEKIKLMEELIIFHRKSEIDLIDLRTADPVLRYEIGVNGRLLYEKSTGLFDKYCLFYIKAYYELKPVILSKLEILKSEIREVLENAR